MTEPSPETADAAGETGDYLVSLSITWAHLGETLESRTLYGPFPDSATASSFVTRWTESADKAGLAHGFGYSIGVDRLTPPSAAQL